MTNSEGGEIGRESKQEEEFRLWGRKKKRCQVGARGQAGQPEMEEAEK